MSYLPDWNSIESTTRWSNGLFWLGIASLLLLAIAEVASHVFSSRAAALQAEVLQKTAIGRKLSAEQHATVRTVLSHLEKRSQVRLWSAQGDGEAVRLANALKPDFDAAGFSVDGVWENQIIGGAGPGVLVRRYTGDKSGIAEGIDSAFRQVALTSRLVEIIGSGDEIQIFVSYRPD